MAWNYSFVDWALHNHSTLSAGEWPDVRSEDRVMVQHAKTYHAPFEAPCFLAGYVAAKVKQCGYDGFLVEKAYGLQNGIVEPASTMALVRQIPEDEIKRRINKVKNYVADATNVPYEDWKREHRFEARLRTMTITVTQISANMVQTS